MRSAVTAMTSVSVFPLFLALVSIVQGYSLPYGITTYDLCIISMMLFLPTVFIGFDWFTPSHDAVIELEPARYSDMLSVTRAYQGSIVAFRTSFEVPDCQYCDQPLGKGRLTCSHCGAPIRKEDRR